MSKKGKDAAGFNTPFARSLRTLGPKAAPERAPVRKIAPPKAPAPPADDAQAFFHAMHGVRPIKAEPSRVEPRKKETTSIPDDDELAMFELESLVRGEGDFRLYDSDELQWGMAPGASHELLRRLQAGAFAYRRHLDLHGLTAIEARQALVEFVVGARRGNERCVLVITGRGKGSPDGIAVLRDILPRWLSRAPLCTHVIAFCSAVPADGGPGAFYILLRRAGVRPFGKAL